jgi:lipopolysaccharide transport system ATP-binding protein
VADAGVVVDQMWKKFRRGERHDSLRDLVPAITGTLFRRNTKDDLANEEFWAVREISFDVRPGEAVGIIGPNGAGKSTILKLLTRILKPTRGVCRLNGRVGALIEIAAGFHPDLTGRENVYLQGAIMGMKRAEIARKFDAIVEFAGVGAFIDTQVKRYSSGMNARLGFAIAAHLDPDVMIIDEVLSVGDASFQEKCVRQMQGMVKRGVPLVFVSHNLPAVVDLCTRVLVIGAGQVVFDGEPAAGVQAYRQATFARDWNTGRRDDHAPIRISRVELVNGAGEQPGVFETRGPMTIRIWYEAREMVAHPNFVVDIHRADGTYCSGIGTYLDCDLGTLHGSGSVDLTLPRLTLLPGCYALSAGIHRADGTGLYDLHYNAYPFSVTSSLRDLGVVYLDHEWRHQAETVPCEAVG